VQSTKTYKRWGSARRKQRWQLVTDTDGVGVWPNVSCWMQDESRSSSSRYSMCRAATTLLVQYDFTWLLGKHS